MHISRICKLYVQLTNFLIPIEFHELLNLIFDFLFTWPLEKSMIVYLQSTTIGRENCTKVIEKNT